MKKIVDVRIFRYECPDEWWGIRYRRENGDEVRRVIGSRAHAIAVAAKLRRPPKLRVIEGGRQAALHDKARVLRARFSPVRPGR
jgi:hypothetical protein